MNLCQTIASNEATQGSFRWSQLDTAQAFADFSDPFDPPISQRQYAQEHAIPRSTGVFRKCVTPVLAYLLIHIGLAEQEA
jgi:hypothetical protein